MNPRKKFLDMNPAERTQFLDALTLEMNLPEFHPLKKAILEKIIQYARDQLANPQLLSVRPDPKRYATCDAIFDAKNMAALCFLEKVIQALHEIPDSESKLRDAVLGETVQRRQALLEKHVNISTGFSIAMMASSLIANWSSAFLLLTGGLALYKYSEGLVSVRAAQAFEDQSKMPLLNHGVPQRLDGDFGDTIENISTTAIHGAQYFLSSSASFFGRKYHEYMRGQQAPAANPNPGLVVLQ